MSDEGRPRPTNYSLTLDVVARRFADAGLPRDTRSLQRYCASGRLDCIKESTVTGPTYFVDPDSVDRAIRQLAQLHALTDEARQTSTGEPVSASVGVHTEPKEETGTARSTAVDRDKPGEKIGERHTSTQPDTSGVVALLERENESLREQGDFFRHQIEVKDTQIAALLERDKETNYLVRGLQTMLAPLLGRGGNADRHPEGDQHTGDGQ
jgi:hypothetical protein